MAQLEHELDAVIEQVSGPLNRLRAAVGERIVGQERMIEGLLIGLLADGHILLEGVPGLAKTLTISTLSQGIDASFQRVQFTPDLLPADLIGTQIYNPKDASFFCRKGPIFANIVLADEINRAPAKVQSALLEAMQERQVTIGDETFPLPDPFLVLATQNPIEQEGTYPLPEAQVDRFMLKLKVGYPTRQQEREILDRMATTSRAEPIKPALHADEVVAARKGADQVHVDDRIKDYIVDLVMATREPDSVSGIGTDLARLVQFGASPRATIALTVASRAQALLSGRGYVTPEDVKRIAPEVLGHRVIVTYEAEAQDITSDDVVSTILDHVAVP